MKEISYPIPKKLSYPITTAEKKKKSKYGNKKVIIDRIKFDSQKEANRYLYLNLLQKEGLISDLRLQVKYELQPSYQFDGRLVKPIIYTSDFSYYDCKEKQVVIEDVKGYRTLVYKLKKKMFEYKYGIEIKEI
jgi:hypothetical protein